MQAGRHYPRPFIPESNDAQLEAQAFKEAAHQIDTDHTIASLVGKASEAAANLQFNVAQSQPVARFTKKNH